MNWEAFDASIDEASLVMWQNADYVWMHSAQFRSLKSREEVSEAATFRTFREYDLSVG